MCIYIYIYIYIIYVCIYIYIKSTYINIYIYVWLIGLYGQSKKYIPLKANVRISFLRAKDQRGQELQIFGRCRLWIGLRENLQETTDFLIKYGRFL